MAARAQASRRSFVRALADLGPVRRRLPGRVLPRRVRPDVLHVPGRRRSERLHLRRGADHGAALLLGRAHLHHPRRGHGDSGAAAALGSRRRRRRLGGRHHLAFSQRTLFNESIAIRKRTEQFIFNWRELARETRHLVLPHYLAVLSLGSKFTRWSFFARFVHS